MDIVSTITEGSILAAIISFVTTYTLVAIILGVLLLVAEWMIFVKAGEPGWKCLIPVYDVYVLFRICWKTGMFWVYLLCSAVGSVLTQMEGDMPDLIGSVFELAAAVILIMTVHKLSRSFGHGLGFTLGLLFIPNLFTLILGLGSSEYYGPQD